MLLNIDFEKYTKNKKTRIAISCFFLILVIISCVLTMIFEGGSGIFTNASICFLLATIAWFEMLNAHKPKSKFIINTIKSIYERRGNLEGYKKFCLVLLKIFSILAICYFFFGVISLIDGIWQENVRGESENRSKPLKSGF